MVLILLSALIHVFAPSCSADTKALMTVYSNKNGTMTTSLAADIYNKGKKIRVETRPSAQGKATVTIISDQATKKTYLLMPAQHMAMTTSLSQFGIDTPECSSAPTLARCARTEGYTKTGSEKIAGHSCDIYSKLHTKNNKTSHITLWVPTNGYLPLRIEVRKTADAPIDTRVDLTEIKDGQLANSLFTVPEDFRTLDVGNLGSLLNKTESKPKPASKKQKK